MAYNPYEEEFREQDALEELNEVVESALEPVEQQQVQPIEGEEGEATAVTTPQETETHHESGKIKGTRTKEFLNTQFEERKAWKDLPEGPEKEAAKEAWNIKYYGSKDPNILQRTGVDFFERAKGTDASAIGGLAAGAGLIDTGTDALNLIPGVNIPKLPEFESNALQGVRQISALILPMRMLKGLAIAKGTAVHKAGVAPQKVQALGNSRIFKWASEAGIDLGTGAIVDYVSKQNEQDDNLAGMFKKWAPKTSQFIPNSIATLDTDSPDIKRAKNVKEGALLGFFGSLIEGMALLGKSGASVTRAAKKFIPENELAKKNLKELTSDEFTNVKFDENPVTDQVLRAEARANKELDNLGNYHLQTDPNFTEAKLGRDDVFDANESSVRAVDADGVPGAAADNARILNDIDTTYGRLGNIVTEPALKLGLDPTNLSNRSLVRMVAQQLKKAGHFSQQLASGKKLSNKLIDESGVRLAEILNDPRMQPGEMKLLLDEFRVDIDGIKAVNRQGNQSLSETIKLFKSEILDMDAEKARAYLLTSQAGQISDIAEGGRLMDGTGAVARAQHQILDKLQYLMVEKGLATYQSKARRTHLKAWKQAAATNDPEIMEEALGTIMEDVNNQLLKIIPEAEKFSTTLRGIIDEQPEFLRTFMLANEMTDGDIDSMYKLNTFVQNKLGTFSKAFVDGKPDIPSILNRTQMSIIFNSILSSFATPIRALYGNLGGLIGKPASVFSGAVMRGDGLVLRRAFNQYAAFTDSFTKAAEHMKVVYRKAATDPTSIGYIMRDDLAIKEVQELELLRGWAQAAEEKGEYGASALLTVFEEQDKLARHPWLRFGANSMTALDGFNRAMYAAAEAKGRAFDHLLESGREITPESLQQASDEIYKTFFDAKGMITDEAVDFATRESALNLDSGLVSGLNSVLRRVPILRSIFMFPRTQANSLDIFRKWSPVDALHIGHKFEGDYAAFNKYSWENYPEDELKQLLASKGIAFDSSAEMQFRTKQAEYKGRVAIGTTTIMGGFYAATQDRIRGNGNWDSQVQGARREVNWQAKTYKGWDGKWYSYDFLGPIGDLLAFSADLVDNFDSMSTSTFEKMGQKLAFIMGASVTNKSVLQSLEPLNDILAGNPAAGARWASMLANAYLPLAGLRADLTRLMAPMKREYENEVGDLIRNRNGFIDVIDPDGSLPYKYNFITGKPIGYPSNWWARVNNAINPWKVHDGLSEEEQFLVDVEFDSRPYFNKSPGGVEYDIHQRAELYSKIGEHGIFRDGLKDIMHIANSLSYTDKLGNTYNGYTEIITALRRGNISQTEVDNSEFGTIIPSINQLLSQSIRLAQAELHGTGRFIDIDTEEAYIRLKKSETRAGDVDSVLEINEELQQLQQQVQPR